MLRAYGYGRFRRMKLLRQDKGHRAELNQWVQRVQSGGQPMMNPQDIWSVTQTAIQAESALH